MPTQAWSLLSPCIAVRRDHFEVAAKSAYYGRSPHYRVGRAIFDAYGVRSIASAMKTSSLVFAAFGSHAIYGLPGSLRSRPTS